MPRPLSQIFDALGYTLSLPERLVRSLAAGLGGASKILTDTVIPEPLRKTSTFTALIGNAQRFVIEQVADVQGVYARQDGAALPDNYVPRKIAGNVMEAAGMFSVHLSPLWVFAIATDMAHGSKVYLNRLVDELKQNRVIDKDTNVKEIDELLEAVGKAGKQSAKVFDAPPVNLAQIKDLRAQITHGYKNVFKEAGDLVPRIDTLWAKMESLAKRDGVAVESIVGLMTVDLGKAAGKALGTAFAIGNVTTDLLGEAVLQSYGETIDRVQQLGVAACIDEATRPFVEAISANMIGEKQTWTQRAWRKVVGPLVGDASDDVTDGASDDVTAGASDDATAEASDDVTDEASDDATDGLCDDVGSRA